MRQPILSVPPVRRAASLCAGLLAMLLALTAVAAHRYDFEARQATVNALVLAAQRLQDGRSVERAVETVGTLQAAAQAAWEAGDADQAYGQLDQAYTLVQLVVRRLASQPGVIAPAVAPEVPATPATETRQRRYASLQASVQALEEAYRAVRAELADSALEVTPQVAALRSGAERDRAAGRLDDALPQLKQAYALLQGEIVRLRGGQTLVRELRFGSAREEYEYEVDRHDTYLLLAQLLLEGPRADPAQAGPVRAVVDESLRLHWVAHKYAAAGEYREAVAWLEQASDALVVLIRRYGHDLP